TGGSDERAHQTGRQRAGASGRRLPGPAGGQGAHRISDEGFRRADPRPRPISEKGTFIMIEIKNRVFPEPSGEESGGEAAIAEAKRFADRSRRAVEQTISQYPIAMLGAAVGVGVFLGWLVKRR